MDEERVVQQNLEQEETEEKREELQEVEKEVEREKTEVAIELLKNLETFPLILKLWLERPKKP